MNMLWRLSILYIQMITLVMLKDNMSYQRMHEVNKYFFLLVLAQDFRAKFRPLQRLVSF